LVSTNRFTGMMHLAQGMPFKRTFLSRCLGIPEEASTFPTINVIEQGYVYDASSAGDYVEEPVEEPVYAYDAFGTGNLPGNPEEASTFDNNEQVYGSNAVGNLVQEGSLSRFPWRHASLVWTRRFTILML
jgi:hypothetical protein